MSSGGVGRVALPKLSTDSTRAGQVANRSRKLHFRSNQFVREHALNFEDTSLTATTLKQHRGGQQQRRGNGGSSIRSSSSATAPKHVIIGNELMKRTGEKNVAEFEIRAARRARLLRKQRIVFLFTRIQNRAVEKIQRKVRACVHARACVRIRALRRPCEEFFTGRACRNYCAPRVSTGVGGVARLFA
jgi:hypothetical protein